MRKCLYFIAIFQFILISYSQKNTLTLSNPQQSAIVLAKYINNDEEYNQKIVLLFNSKTKSKKEINKIAKQLKQILVGRGVIINPNNFSNDPDFIDSKTHQSQYVLSKTYPKIYFIKINNSWVFDDAVIDEITLQHNKLFIFGTDQIVEIFYSFGNFNLMGLHPYHWASIVILLFLLFLCYKTLTYIVNKVFLKIVLNTGHEHLHQGYLLPIAKPFSLFIILYFDYFFIPIFQFPAHFAYYFGIIIKILISVFGTIFFYRITNIFCLYLQLAAKKTENTLDDQLVPLIRKTLKIIVLFFGTLFILKNFEIDLLPLLTGLSIGGIAFALAAQETLKNFLGSVMIFIDKPFQINDWIVCGEIDGNVEEVGFRSTRIRTFTNSVMVVPNSLLTSSNINNYGLRQYRRFYTQIQLVYDTPPEVIKTFLEGLTNIVVNHPNTRKDYYNIYLNDLGSHSLVVMFYIFFIAPDWPSELKARNEILFEILELAEKLKIQFAFPTQTINVQNPHDQSSKSHNFLNTAELKIQLDEFTKKAK